MVELRRGERPVLRIGHRGAAALAPENTLRSLALAAELGVDLVEFDVVRDPDGRLVLAHDRRALVPAAPTLDDALELVAGLGVGVHLDLKVVGEERRVADALRRHGLVSRTLVSSFQLRTLRALRAAEPEIPRALSYPDDRLGLARWSRLDPLVRHGARGLGRALPYRIPRWLRATGAAVASLSRLVVTRALVERCHALGVAVYAWTVNDVATARRVLETGLDGIITDDPRIFEDL